MGKTDAEFDRGEDRKASAQSQSDLNFNFSSLILFADVTVVPCRQPAGFWTI